MRFLRKIIYLREFGCDHHFEWTLSLPSHSCYDHRIPYLCLDNSSLVFLGVSCGFRHGEGTCRYSQVTPSAIKFVGNFKFVHHHGRDATCHTGWISGCDDTDKRQGFLDFWSKIRCTKTIDERTNNSIIFQNSKILQLQCFNTRILSFFLVRPYEVEEIETPWWICS